MKRTKIFFTGLLLLTAFVARAQFRRLEQIEVIKVEGITSDNMIYDLTPAQKTTTRIYMDGLERPIQQVMLGGSASQKDIVQPISYDNLGRSTVSYLPYAASNGSGVFRPNAFTEQAAFYSNGKADKVADDSMPFSKQLIENSPLQRLLQSGAPGSGFQPGEHYSSVNYRSNNSTTDGNIIIWLADGTRSSNYADGKLSVTEATDADGNKALVYKDLLGRPVLKRQVLDATHKNDTYYIYNKAGGLNYVLPPKAVKLILDNPSYTIAQASVASLIFKYQYDAKNRLSVKTIPGSGDLYILYDALDRPVLLQDANLRAGNKWNYIKYDIQDRPVIQGYYTDAVHTTPASMDAYIGTSTLGYSSNVAYVSGDSNSSNGYYTNDAFPNSNTTPLVFSYYDNYDMNFDGTPDFLFTNPVGLQTQAATNLTRGMLTMTRTRTVGPGLSDLWLSKVMFFDKRGNVIQVKSGNHLMNTTSSLASYVPDIATSVPYFTGLPRYQQVVKNHSAIASTTVLTTFEYDHMMRPATIKQSYNGSTDKIVATYEYNEMGQLVDKKLGYNGAGTAWLQSVDYRYNIRGQLLSINNSKLENDLTGSTNDDANDVFGEEILYNVSNTQIASTGTYGGKISAVKWMSLNASNVKSNERSLKYSYDGLGRYTQSLYAERSSTATPATNFNLNVGGFDEKGISYDENGNIQKLKRYSSTVGGSGGTLIDNLVYNYDANNANRLLKINDSTTVGAGFQNYADLSSGNYIYDDGGNLKGGPYKRTSAIDYNVLNRMEKVTLAYSTMPGRYIDYTYDATGKLIRKRKYDNSILQTTTDYVDGFVYTTAGTGAAQLDYFGMPEGRVRNTGGGTPNLKQEYIITDHQGNARVSFEDNGSGSALVRQENSYYGFGMNMTSYTSPTPISPNKNLYNGGSEWQNDFNDQPDWQQTFYRNYDQTTGRFLAPDPMAEASADLSNYQYSGNNPIMNNDPLGNLHISSQYPLGMPDPVQIIVRNFGGPQRLKFQSYREGLGGYDEMRPSSAWEANAMQAEAANWASAQQWFYDRNMAGYENKGWTNVSNEAISPFLSALNERGFDSDGIMRFGYYRNGSSIGPDGKTQVDIRWVAKTINLNYSNQSSDVKILIANSSAWNDVGHTAIQLNSSYVLGYYPTSSDGSAYGSKDLSLSKGNVHIASRADFNLSYEKQGYTEYSLKLTSQQMLSLQNYLSKIVADPGNYNLLVNNCTSVIINALKDAGIFIRDQYGNETSAIGISPYKFGTLLNNAYYMPGETVTNIQKFGGN